MAVDFSILIPTCNRVSDVQQCLDKLRVAILAAPEIGCEVIVGNDGPPEDIERITSTDFPCDIRILQGPRLGPASNRNHLASEAKGKLLLFIDDDVKPSPNLISAYIAAQRAHPEAGIFEGRIVRESEPKYAYDEIVENEIGGFLWTANLAVLKDVFHKLNGFDTDFPFAAFEDTEFRFRSQAAAIATVWCPEASVTHPVVARKGHLPYTKHRYSLLVFVSKYPQYLDAMKHDFALIQCLRALKHFIVKRSVIQPLDGYRSVLHRISSILITRHLLHHPSSIPSALARMEVEMNLPPRAAKLKEALQSEHSGQSS